LEAGDPDHWLPTRDGALILKGVPVEALRKELAASGGMRKGRMAGPIALRSRRTSQTVRGG